MKMAAAITASRGIREVAKEGNPEVSVSTAPVSSAPSNPSSFLRALRTIWVIQIKNSTMPTAPVATDSTGAS